MAKLTEKEVLDILGIKTAGMPEEQKNFVLNLSGAFTEAINKSIEGTIDTKGLQDALAPLNEQKIALDDLSKENQQLVDQVKSLSETLEKMKQRGLNLDFVNKFDESFNEMYDSEKFQRFINDHGPAAKGFVIKDVSLTNNYTGDARAMLTQQSNIIVTQAVDKKDHIRNHVVFLESDEEKTSITYQEIYDVDRNARYVTENGMLPESSFKVREKSAEVKRCGTSFRLSKRMLKNRKFVRAFVLTKIMQAVYNAEDFGLIYGDGNSDNLKGITTYDGVRSVESILSDQIVSILAGGVESINKVGNGVEVHLTKPYDLLRNGYKVTVAGAVNNTGLNGTFSVIMANDTTLFLEGAVLSNEGSTELNADADSITLTVRNGLYKSIESPNSIDALEAAVAVMTYAEFEPTILALNPLTITQIKSEKATDGNRLEVVKDINGNMVIGPLTVLPCKDIPVGEYFTGDMETGCAIIEYTPLMLEWCDDVETKLKNQVVLYAQEELIFPVMKPHAFSRGRISALIDALKKD